MPGKQEKPAGSLISGEPAFLVVGKVRRPHGLNGSVLTELHTDFPQYLVPGKDVFWGDEHRKLIIRENRAHKDGLLLSFDGYFTPEQVGFLRNQYLFVTSDETTVLADGEYYFHQLIDLEVQDESGVCLGSLTEVIETGANDVYIVTSPAGGEILLPAIKDVVKKIDLKKRRMVVHLLPGLISTPGKDHKD